jgi:acetyltransferase
VAEAARGRAHRLPVALKIRSRDILHKTEAGGVALGLQDREAVQAAAQALVASARAREPDARIDGFAGDGVGDRGHRRSAQRPLYGPMLLLGAAACWSSSSRTPRCACFQ